MRNEHDLHNFLRKEAKNCARIRYYKNYGSACQSGQPDVFYVCPHGNWLIELKWMEFPKRSSTAAHPFKDVTGPQWDRLDATYRINGQAAIGIGFEVGSCLYVAFFSPVLPEPEWFPHQHLDKNVYRKRGAPWPWDAMSSKLCSLLKTRYNLPAIAQKEPAG